MGWSFNQQAGKTMDALTEACFAQSGSQNVFTSDRGQKFFWETSRTEHADGAITGSVHRFVGADSCRAAGSFRIEGNGTMTRGPKFLKDVARAEEQRYMAEVFPK